MADPYHGPERRTFTRPRASLATIANSVIIVSALIGGGITSFGFFADIKADIRGLQVESKIANQTVTALSVKIDKLYEARRGTP